MNPNRSYLLLLLLAIVSGVAIGLWTFGLAGRDAPSTPTPAPAPSVAIAPEAAIPFSPATPVITAPPKGAPSEVAPSEPEPDPSVAATSMPPTHYDNPGLVAAEPPPPRPPIPPQQIGTPPPAAAPQ